MNSKQRRSSELGGNECFLECLLSIVSDSVFGTFFGKTSFKAAAFGVHVGDDVPRMFRFGLNNQKMKWLSPPSSLDRRSMEFIVSPKKVVGCRGGSRYVEG